MVDSNDIYYSKERAPTSGCVARPRIRFERVLQSRSYKYVSTGSEARAENLERSANNPSKPRGACKRTVRRLSVWLCATQRLQFHAALHWAVSNRNVSCVGAHRANLPPRLASPPETARHDTRCGGLEAAFSEALHTKKIRRKHSWEADGLRKIYTWVT